MRHTAPSRLASEAHEPDILYGTGLEAPGSLELELATQLERFLVHSALFEQPVILRMEFLRLRPVSLDHVSLLPGIGSQVVELNRLAGDTVNKRPSIGRHLRSWP